MPRSQEVVLIWFTMAVLGLHKIHSEKFIHRDIKPDNILLSNKMIKIGDFGLVKNNASA